MNVYDINIFVPNFWRLKESGRLKGYTVESLDNVLGIYIYDKYPGENLKNNCCNEWNQLNSSAVLDCFVCKNKSRIISYDFESNLSYLCLEMTNKKVNLKELKINGQIIDLSSMIRNCVIMFYDYNSILKSEDFFSSQPNQKIPVKLGDKNQFEILKTIIKHNHCICPKQFVVDTDPTRYLYEYTIFNLFSTLFGTLCKYSNLCMQFQSFVNSIYWSLYCIWREKKVSVRVGNLMASMIVDFIIGLLILYWINQWTQLPVDELFKFLELIVDNLRSLLKWLMGSPAGLKLNHAFNNMLGKFFLYHIELWWMFLVIIRDVLELAFKIFQYTGMLGITFQTAILADLLSLASFHVYCIYTYAARLYNIQISGLIALWRLFLGRKHNPLRGGVDSCEYNYHQLFVGTLAFTILLFLMPTTALYYVVFATFRIILVILGGLLMWIRYIIQSLPIYLIFLRLIKSTRIAGEINISLIPEVELINKPILLDVTLQFSSIFQLMKKYQPPVLKPSSIQWGEIISTLCRGKLLYPV